MQQSGVWWRARARADGTPLPMIPWCGSRRGDARLEVRTRCGDSMCACVAWLQSCRAFLCRKTVCVYYVRRRRGPRARGRDLGVLDPNLCRASWSRDAWP